MYTQKSTLLAASPYYDYDKNRESKMTKFLKWCLRYTDSKNQYRTDELGRDVSASPQLSTSPQLFFTVFNAVGGKVVEFRRHDSRTDQHISTIYVINKDDEFGDRIAKIIAMESFK